MKMNDITGFEKLTDPDYLNKLDKWRTQIQRDQDGNKHTTWQTATTRDDSDRIIGLYKTGDPEDEKTADFLLDLAHKRAQHLQQLEQERHRARLVQQVADIKKHISRGH
jgi:hypothetical protein